MFPSTLRAMIIIRTDAALFIHELQQASLWFQS